MTNQFNKRQTLMEIMVKAHRITTDLANYHIAKMTDAEVDEKLALYRKQERSRSENT